MTIPPGMKYADFNVQQSWIAAQDDPDRARWVLLLGTAPLDERPKASGQDDWIPDVGRLSLEYMLCHSRPLFGGRAGIRDDGSPSWDTSVREMEDAISMIDENFFA